MIWYDIVQLTSFHSSKRIEYRRRHRLTSYRTSHRITHDIAQHRHGGGEETSTYPPCPAVLHSAISISYHIRLDRIESNRILSDCLISSHLISHHTSTHTTSHHLFSSLLFFLLSRHSPLLFSSVFSPPPISLLAYIRCAYRQQNKTTDTTPHSRAEQSG